ncbi:hypothetical protein HPB50_024214 [Hyalomma asiaticum]|uniref:Uncharacterized protein n=1 Tax=Hyalomma asiaticum TaxID=266040 RepID=A0ACB7ST15_HYAAI|nr:hypothetical protein HPB50_024214 [Hyalomma asiaticum]
MNATRELHTRSSHILSTSGTLLKGHRRLFIGSVTIADAADNFDSVRSTRISPPSPDSSGDKRQHSSLFREVGSSSRSAAPPPRSLERAAVRTRAVAEENRKGESKGGVGEVSVPCAAGPFAYRPQQQQQQPQWARNTSSPDYTTQRRAL